MFNFTGADSQEKLAAACAGCLPDLVVNTATAQVSSLLVAGAGGRIASCVLRHSLRALQCEARQGFWGDSVRVVTVDLEDDPDERKKFDAGQQPSQSRCGDASVPLHLRCAGDAAKDFERV